MGLILLQRNSLQGTALLAHVWTMIFIMLLGYKKLIRFHKLLCVFSLSSSIRLWSELTRLAVEPWCKMTKLSDVLLLGFRALRQMRKISGLKRVVRWNPSITFEKTAVGIAGVNAVQWKTTPVSRRRKQYVPFLGRWHSVERNGCYKPRGAVRKAEWNTLRWTGYTGETEETRNTSKILARKSFGKRQTGKWKRWNGNIEFDL
jgi:hypothetical protein